MMAKMPEFKKFLCPQDVQTWIEHHYSNEQLINFSVRHQPDSPLAMYKGNGYKWMNERVRVGGINEPDILELQKSLMQQKIPESIQVFRFVDLKELVTLLWETRRQRSFEYPGFLSTTLLPEYYSMVDLIKDRTVISLFIEKGVCGMCLPEVNPNMPEFEILFPHHLKLNRMKWNQFLIKTDS